MFVTIRHLCKNLFNMKELPIDLVSRGEARLLRALPRTPHPHHAPGRHDALRGLLHVLDRLPGRVHHHRGRRGRADAREVPGALRDRPAALHLLRLLRRCLPRGCDLHDPRLRDGHRHARARRWSACATSSSRRTSPSSRWAGARTTARWRRSGTAGGTGVGQPLRRRRSRTTRRRIPTSTAAR